MTLPKRNCVFVALSNTVGHELVFRHYTNKVVVGTYSQPNSQGQKTSNNNRKKKP